MKFFRQLVLSAFLAIPAQMYMPWWIVSLVCFSVAFFVYNEAFISFIAGYLAIGLLWFSYAFYIDNTTESILTVKIAQLFQLNNKWLLIGATSIVGGLAGGFSAMCGTYFKDIFKKNDRQTHLNYYRK